MLNSGFKNILIRAPIFRAAILFVVAGCLTLVCTSQIKAQTTLNFNPTSTFSGNAPAGSLSASFTDITGASCVATGGCVQLTITSKLSTAGTEENLDPGKALYLNFDPSDSLNLAFSLTGSKGFNQAATVLVNENMYKADGDGYYDILFTYSPSTKPFVGGTSQTYLITGNSSSDPITASDFTTFYSSETSCCGGMAGSAGPFIAAIHVQEPGGSGWVSGDVSATPEPASMLLFGTGLFAIGGILRRRKAHSVPAIS